MSKIKDENQELLDVKNDDSRSNNEISVNQAEKRDPLKIQNIVLAEDFYALTWVSLRKSTWQHKEMRGVPITLTEDDFFWIRFNFTFFVSMLLLTVLLLLYEVFTNDTYEESVWQIYLLRITLVCFAQKSLSPEFYQGLSEFRYSLRKRKSFSHPNFAIFVGFSQTMVAVIAYFGIILFICMADKALELVIDFAGLSVICKLDDWIGEQIMAERLICKPEDENDKNEDYDLEDLNNNMTCIEKISLIDEEDLEIIDDQNDRDKYNGFYKCVNWIIEVIPWQVVLPLVTLPVNFLLIAVQSDINDKFFKK